MILVRLKGGLGNQMFQYATAKALAMEHNTDVKIDLTLLQNISSDPNYIRRDFELNGFNFQPVFASEKEIKNYNPLPVNTIDRITTKIRKSINPLRTYIEQSHNYNSKIFELPDDYCIVGAFQSEKYFLKHEKIIRNDYQIAKPLTPKSKSLLEKIISSNAICIHVRRGDYVNSKLYSGLLGAKNENYYQNAFEYISKIQNDNIPFVFSDDIEWCKKELKLPANTIFADQNVIEADHHLQLLVMMNCKHFIISNSTFGWWAAWLCKNKNKIVIAPEVWFNDKSKDEKDIIPNDWITM